MIQNHDFFKIKSNNVMPSIGKVLVAEPLLQGKYFARSVVLITEHNEKGSMGIVLNRPLSINVSDMISPIPNFKQPMYLGGPVNTDHIFFLHSLGEVVDKSLHLFDDIYWGGNINRIFQLLNDGICTPQNIRFFAGYAGWSPGQLNNELDEKSWLVTNIPASCVFEEDIYQLWSKSVKQLGKNYKHWLHFPSNIEDN